VPADRPEEPKPAADTYALAPEPPAPKPASAKKPRKPTATDDPVVAQALAQILGNVGLPAPGAAAGEPVCDICNASVREPEGYLLTTRQVVSSPGYWESYFRQHQGQFASLFEIATYKQFLKADLTVRARLTHMLVEQTTPWMVCPKCIELFPEVSRKKTRAYAEKWWADGKTFRPPGTGPAELGDVDLGDGPRMAGFAPPRGAGRSAVTGGMSPEKLAYGSLATGLIGLLFSWVPVFNWILGAAAILTGVQASGKLDREKDLWPLVAAYCGLIFGLLTSFLGVLFLCIIFRAPRDKDSEPTAAATRTVTSPTTARETPVTLPPSARDRQAEAKYEVLRPADVPLTDFLARVCRRAVREDRVQPFLFVTAAPAKRTPDAAQTVSDRARFLLLDNRAWFKGTRLFIAEPREVAAQLSAAGLPDAGPRVLRLDSTGRPSGPALDLSTLPPRVPQTELEERIRKYFLE
jgi:hypothetical protein